MGRTFHICTIVGIPLKVHWSFGLMVLFVAYIIHLHQLSTAASIGFASLVLVMFICVILHELGHSMAARRFGIDTIDIIISPIGGLARLKDIPEQPSKEFFIAIAGPAVNVVIAIIIGCYLHFIIGTELIPSSDNFELLGYSIDFLKFVFMINIMLFIFNLIPAFPMDGGRVLRALLSVKLERVLATRVAMWIARGFSFAFVWFAVYTNNITLGLIGLFVYIMSGKEYAHVKMVKKASTKVSEVFRSKYTKVLTEDSYQRIIDIYKKGEEKNFLVYDNNDNLVGAVPEIYIKDAIKRKGNLLAVVELMSSKVATISMISSIRKVSEMMNTEGVAICAVQEGNIIVGVLDRNDIGRFMRP